MGEMVREGSARGVGEGREVAEGELSGRELSMGGSARGGKRRGELPGGEVS